MRPYNLNSYLRITIGEENEMEKLFLISDTYNEIFKIISPKFLLSNVNLAESSSLSFYAKN